MSFELLVDGMKVRARLYGWDDSQNKGEAAPLYEGAPEFVEGPLVSRQGRFGTIWSVNGWDIDESTVEEIELTIDDIFNSVENEIGLSVRVEDGTT